MRIASLSMVLFLAACHTTPADPSFSSASVKQSEASSLQVGSMAWMEMVTERAGVSDGHGGGPDYGSQEWCNAVQYRLLPSQASGQAECDQAWMQSIDTLLQQKK